MLQHQNITGSTLSQQWHRVRVTERTTLDLYLSDDRAWQQLTWLDGHPAAFGAGIRWAGAVFQRTAGEVKRSSEPGSAGGPAEPARCSLPSETPAGCTPGGAHTFCKELRSIFCYQRHPNVGWFRIQKVQYMFKTKTWLGELTRWWSGISGSATNYTNMSVWLNKRP